MLCLPDFSTRMIYVVFIQVINPTDQDAIVDVEQMGLGDWPDATTQIFK